MDSTLIEDIVRKASREDGERRDLYREEAAHRLLDTLGVGLAAARAETGLAATKLASARNSGGAATLWADSSKVTPSDAALANGTLAHALDWDDTHCAAIMHIGAVTVPALIAIAEQQASSCSDLLDAVVTGYNVASWLGQIAPGDFQRNGFQSTCVLGAQSAVVACAQLRGDDEQTTLNAAGIAGSMTAGIMEYLGDGSETKQLHPGWAAHAAIYALELAEHGATGPRGVLDGRFGIYRAFLGWNEEKLDGRVKGIDWGADQIFKTSTKLYPSCHATHAAIDACKDLHESLTRDDLGRIEEMTCHVPDWYVGLVLEPSDQKARPRTLYEARFSLPFCMAIALTTGDFDLGKDSAVLEDKGLLALAEKVRYEIQDFPSFPSSMPAAVDVRLADGRVLHASIEAESGSASNPLTAEDRRRKFSRALGLNSGGEIYDELHVALTTPDSQVAHVTQAISNLSRQLL